VYNLRLSKWLPPLDGVQVPPIQFHTAVLLNDAIYIFGGKSNGYRNDCYRLDVNGKVLTKIEPKGPAPAPRYGHSAVAYKGKMFIFGGYDNTAMACNDLYSFDAGTNTWEKVQIQGPAPPSRFMHSAIIHYQSMYVFGGCGDSLAILGDLYQFNFADSTWTKSKIKGKTPVPRYGHTAITSNFGMYLFGGMDKSKDKTTYFSDLLFWDFGTKEFEIPKFPNDEKLAARANHSCAWDSNSKVLVVSGGKDSSDVLADMFILSPLVCFLDIFPSDLIAHVLSFVKLDDLLALCATSKKLRLECENERLWERLCLRLTPYQLDEAKKKGPITSYKRFLVDNYLNQRMTVYVPDKYAKVLGEDK